MIANFSPGASNTLSSLVTASVTDHLPASAIIGWVGGMKDMIQNIGSFPIPDKSRIIAAIYKCYL